jgi:hypothetical protein
MTGFDTTISSVVTGGMTFTITATSGQIDVIIPVIE